MFFPDGTTGPWGLCLFSAGGEGGGASRTEASVNFLKKAQISEDANNLGEGLKVRRLSGTAGADVEAQSRHSRRRRSAPAGGHGTRLMERKPRETSHSPHYCLTWKLELKKEPRLLDTAFRRLLSSVGLL